jgi:hypothetical protein
MPSGAAVDERIAALEEYLVRPTAADALTDAERWLAAGDTAFARAALAVAKSIRARERLELADLDGDDDDA